MSRYSGSRYDGDRRSRSPRDRSPPYGDRIDRGPRYPDSDRGRPPAEPRGNPGGFPLGRDGFRDSLSGIQPPRGPKALLDPPSGPRGGGFAGDFRGGRGRGGGRGRQWRDDSRDGGRERDDYRERPHFRDERSRERERDRDRERERDRDREHWQRDQRDRVDFPRARRPSPPPIRGRSPLPARDFRDARDAREPPLNVDAERARRESRDGPLSAGSSNSDPMFAPSPFRGGFGRGGRGGGRGRGDWDQRGGRDRSNFYDDRDRYPRSRSQESRWGREQEDRDRRDNRYPDMARDFRDDRDARDNQREIIRPKPDRVLSHEPPSTKDVSPPPLAPSAPAFGSVPTRQPSSTEIHSITGKLPPTGPRALTEERPGSAGHGVGNDRPPPTGPSKPALSEAAPPIPLGPRAQQQKQQRSSKQWINPSLTVKKVQQESPKTARSHSFTPQSRPGNYRPELSHAENNREFEKRPRSPGARSDSHATAGDRYAGLHVATGPNEIVIKSERGSLSARTSIDREIRTAANDGDVLMGGTEPLSRAPRRQEDRRDERPASPAVSKPEQPQTEKLEKTEEEKQPATVEQKHTVIALPSFRVQLPSKQTATPASEESSESEDDEDMDIYFDQQISKAEAELQKLEDAYSKVPMRIVRRYTAALHMAMLDVVNDDVTLTSMVGPIPEGLTFPCAKPGTEVLEKPAPNAEVREEVQQDQEKAPTVREPSAIPTVENPEDGVTHPPEPQPKIEEMDTEGSGLPPVPALEEAKPPSEDVEMEDVSEPQAPAPPSRRSISVNGVPVDGEGSAFFPHPFGRTGTEGSTASPDEESEDRTEDDASIYGSIEVVRQYSATPPTEDLPIYNVKPWYQSRRVRKLADESPEFGDFLLGHIRGQTTTVHHAQEELREQYAKDYESYLRFTLSDDPAAVKSRDYFTSSGVQTGTNGKTTGSDSKPEGGRRAAGRFSTELDLDYAIQQSMREHQEKQEREERAQKEKYRSDKEAVIPDMFWTDEEKDQASYYDTAGALPLEKVIASWQVAPWHNNFSAEEAERFEKAYLEFPKQWGKIAKELPNRDFGACIQYYYAKKRELNLKEKLKKQPRRRKKGRGKQRSSALVSELGNIENENEETAQENGENGERRRPPRRAAAPNFGNEVASNADSDGTTPTATPGRRRAGTAADAKNESGAEKPEPAKRGGRKGRQPKADKEAKGPKLLAQAPGAIPSAVAGKTGRSRGNSRAQNPEWVGSPSTPLDLASRTPVPFEVPPGGMQPPLTSPDRGMPPIASTISEVMAPPSLRPEPPPPPASVPTFEIAPPAGPERIRTPQQASSYWSVSETTDFPGLLRAFGTDWASIAGYMQTKTATMVKNYYVRQTKEGGKPEWEQIAMEADSKRSRGEKRPAPPTPTQGPRKRYDVPSAGHRPLAAAEPEDGATAKVETPTQNPGFTRFQVPIAQAPAFSYAEREPVPAPAQPPAQAQQPVRISQKPIPVATPAPPVSESVARPAGWAGDLDAQYSMLAQQKELRDRQRMDLAQREQARPVERAPPLRMKQEPEQAMHHPEAYPQFQQQQRVMSSRIEPAPPTLARQPEPPRTQPYAPPTHAQPVQSLLSDPVAMQQAPPPPAPGHERSLSGIRATPVSMQEHYPTTPVSAPGPPPPNPRPQLMPPSSRPPERKTSSLMALLNDDPPPPPKRVNDVSSAVKPSSTPPPQSMSLRQPPPTSAPGPSRREVEAGYPYARNPPSGPTTAIPPLKPYHTQSPQPQHMRVPSSSMAPTIDPAAAEAQRDYYGRHPYPPQHQTSATNSPQLHPTHHYAPSGPQHPQQHSPQHAQQPPMGYQGQQQPYQPYQVSQAHAASPTPQYAPHPSMSGRREPAPLSARESWPQASAAQQQQQMHHQQQQAAWPPSHQAPPKSSQPPVPAQSAWGAQHGVQAKPPVSSALPPQQHHTWPSSGPSQQPHPLNLREPRGSAVYGSHEAQSPTAGMVHHQHTGSLGSGSRYAPPPQQDTRRPGEPVPPPQAAAQPPYARYSNTPGPAQQTRADPGRSYTPVSAFDPRGPPGPPQGGPPPPQGAGGYPPQQQQQQRQQQEQQEAAMRDAQMREAQMREMQQREMQQREMQQREMQQREMQQREMQQQRDPREAPPPPPQSILGRQLRPQDPYERGGGERRY